jgi:N-sulfoglucosamine sulfohydrolase
MMYRINLTPGFGGIILGIILFLIVFTVNAGNNPERKPNILWIVCEDISPFLGVYGDSVVMTPNLDKLAGEGIRYTHAYTTAGVCAPSRSSIITGMYPTSIGTQHMRTLSVGKYSAVQAYSAVIPEYVKCFPEYLRMNGYFCTNNEKQDYQFEAPVTVWDENSPVATWRNRPADKPFFSVFNLFITHESQLFMRMNDRLLVKPENVIVPPYYPDTKTVRTDIARLLTNIQLMDQQVGEIIQMLKDDHLYENTIIFFYSDHGGALPWMKREILERGTHIPLIIHFPDHRDAGTTCDDLVSAVNFAPTVLSLSGIPVPSYMQGQAFLGSQKAMVPRKYIFSARDRMDTEYDRVRAVRDKQYRYIYNYMPEKPYYQNIEYRLSIPMMKEILTLKDAGKLNPEQMAWFSIKPVEELYDVVNDPEEFHNLAGNPDFQEKLEEMRAAFRDWNNTVGDMSAVSEKEMIRKWWNGLDHPPVTAEPKLIRSGEGIEISCSTPGASIGYRVIKKGESKTPVIRRVISYDFGTLMNQELSNKQMPLPDIWEVYKNNEIIKLGQGDTLKVSAMRIGYKDTRIDFVY